MEEKPKSPQPGQPGTAVPPPETIKEGYIMKEGNTVMSWRDRYLVIETEKLSYYTNESKKKKQGEIWHKDILDVQPVNPDYKGKKFVFSISTKSERTYYVQAGDEVSRKAWILSVQQLIFEAFVDSLNTVRGAQKAEGNKKIGVDDFERLRVIGRGGFGRVLLVRKKDSQEIFAMKILKKKYIIATKQVTHTTAERNVLVKVEHAFLPKLYYAFQDKTKLYFIMDFINGGELFHHLRKEKRFSEERTRFYAAQIVSAISYLHSLGIIYRDLKPENILLSKEGDIVITDFGLAKEGLHGQAAHTETRAGTPDYLAPEVIKGHKYTKAVDWWSVGILIYEMLYGAPPFICNEGIQQLFEKIVKSNPYFSEKVKVSTDAIDIILKLLSKDPQKRLCDPAKIMAHQWFKTVDWKKLNAKEITPPFIPKVQSEDDISNIDPGFLAENLDEEDENEPEEEAEQEIERKVSIDDLFVGFTFAEKE